ncbi:hypothetical protein JMJ77_0014201 [Colletotrichum scovillei]|uniref:Uncharacterized protein n=1 Tax=Colletotrichum scovillei TaxID=1209932 RepID=A0A9P7UBH3_9PEZI|nr:hypothetical protein JMJ77_0014201 [Colletotrichum scovillei]KAG7065729.1 hypothetical protein JMJ78_0012477 [Colletotrichum scovillei]KAG7068329.1 hypothetical protein JMJ76_0008020 [Colletotrichum scovillei]
MKCGETWLRHVALTQHVSNLVANQLKAVSEASETRWRLEAGRKKQRKKETDQRHGSSLAGPTGVATKLPGLTLRVAWHGADSHQQG